MSLQRYCTTLFLENQDEISLQGMEVNILELKEMREARGLSQAQLADKINVDQSSVCKWESGVSRPLRKYRVALCQVLGCTEQELMGESPQA